MVFVIITLASTIDDGLIADKTSLFLTGAVARVNGLSMEWLFVMTIGGGLLVRVNYWSVRLSGFAIFQGIYRTTLQDRNVRKALNAMEGFCPFALILSRVMPVLNLLSLIAGVDTMEYRMFAGFNLISSAVWDSSPQLIGYFFDSISLINEYLSYFTDLLIVMMIVTIIIAPVTFAHNYVKRNYESPMK